MVPGTILPRVALRVASDIETDMKHAILRRNIIHEIELPLSGIELAELFWSLDERGQAEFFNKLSTEDRLVFQLQAVTDSPALTFDGRYAMAQIGEYSPVSSTPEHVEQLQKGLAEAKAELAVRDLPHYGCLGRATEPPRAHW